MIRFPQPPASDEMSLSEVTDDQIDPTSDDPTSDDPTSDDPTSDDPTSGDPTSRVELIAPTQPPPVVVARGLGKRFDIFLNDRDRVYEFLGRRKHHSEHWALRGVDFQVQRGRSFGVIGPNGAGKSTLLKLIGGITRPTEGTLDIAASLSTLLDLGLGFHQDFTGRENIRLNCRLLGMTDAEAEARLPNIIGFAELGRFIDLPVRTYSAGMQLRLGFSIVAHTDSEIFLVDEVLAVGDQYFQRRCIGKIEEFLAAGRTIILVSHDLHAVRNLCDDVLWLDHGHVRMLGKARDVIERYLDVERERATGGRRVHLSPYTGHERGGTAPPQSAAPPALQPAGYHATVDDPQLRLAVSEACAIADPAALWAQAVPVKPPELTDGDVPIVQGSGEVRILSVRLLDGSGRPRERFRTGEDLLVAVTFRTTQPVPRPIFGAAIFRSDGVYLHGPNTRYDGVLDDTYHGIYTFFILWRKLPLLGGRYRLSVAVFDQHHLKPHAWHNQLYDFEVASALEDHGVVLLDHAWGMITHLKAD